MAHGYDLYGGGREAALSLLESSGYGHLTAWQPGEALPRLTFMHYVLEREAGCILGHLANSNPMLDRFREQPQAVFTVQGAPAYVPSWWSDPERGVPTSYYGWAQAAVTVELVDAQAEIQEILERMLQRFQPEGRHPPMDPAERYWSALLGAITGVRLVIGEVQSRFKYGQNRTEALRREIAGRLETRGSEDDRAAAAMVRATLADSTGKGKGDLPPLAPREKGARP